MAEQKTDAELAEEGRKASEASLQDYDPNNLSSEDDRVVEAYNGASMTAAEFQKLADDKNETQSDTEARPTTQKDEQDAKAAAADKRAAANQATNQK